MLGTFLTSSTSGVMTEVNDVVQSGLSWVSDTASTVTSSPLLMTFTCISLIGVGIGLLRRLIG